MILITDKDLEDVNKQVFQTNYGKEDALITECFESFPKNVDPQIVALKVALIDVTNNTRLSLHKSQISVCEIAEKICSIKDFDQRVEVGDPSLVSELAKTGKVNLFSFASKYCCYHNTNLYKKDDYSIFDNVLKKTLAKHFDISEYKLNQWRNSYKYESYNEFIGQIIKDLHLSCDFKRRKFDRYIWFKYR